MYLLLGLMPLPPETGKHAEQMIVQSKKRACHHAGDAGGAALLRTPRSPGRMAAWEREEFSRGTNFCTLYHKICGFTTLSKKYYSHNRAPPRRRSERKMFGHNRENVYNVSCGRFGRTARPGRNHGGVSPDAGSSGRRNAGRRLSDPRRKGPFADRGKLSGNLFPA